VPIAALAILGPLVAAILALLVRRYAAGVALAGAAVALAGSLVTLARVLDGQRFSTTLPGLPDMPLILAVDPLGAIFSAVVAVVSMFVFVYAVGYMAADEGKARFFAGMSFFAAAMQVLVLAGDWILLLAAWELIGLASYLLIGFWYDRPGVGAAASRAFFTTRAADFGLYLGAIITIVDTGTSSIAAAGGIGDTAGALAGLAFLLAAIGKSAQVPLQRWLQDAMVGPTPVSALLHAATLVVAGVVLLSRAFLLMPDGVQVVVGLVGGVTAVVTGLTAFAQRDLKRLLAGSTSSQLGLMFLAIGAGSIPAAVFHLVTQAAMKSTLFLAAGVFQHDRASTRFDDLRGIGRQRPAVFIAFAVAGLALAGVPPLAGFWSKDTVLAAAMHADTAALLTPLALAGSLVTAIYISRACRLLWQGGEATSGPVAVNRNTVWMGTGLGVLAVLAAVLGLAAGTIEELLGAELPEGTAAVISGLLATAAGLLIGWTVSAPRLLGGVYEWVHSGFRVRDGWTTFAVEPALTLARRADVLDQAIHAVVLGVGQRALRAAAVLRDVDDRVHAVVLFVGRASLSIAGVARLMDEEGIDRLIRRLVVDVRRLGAQARQLQSGLVHQELVLAFGGAAAVLILLLLV
jgi:NADH-quinone oxidoreductase subunit L